MLKKAICFIALFLANFVLLLHAAVPHHYHEQTGVCFAFHCKDSKEAHIHEHSNLDTHQHEGNTSSDECRIDGVYTITDKNIKADYCLHVKCNCEYVLYTLILNNLDIQDFIDSIKIPFQPKPYLLSYHIDYIVQSLGLRAPPF